jgi:SNF2 family DNA or RNA helicase
MLDLIDPALTNQGFGHQRFDGTKSLAQRERALKQFRSNPAYEVLLTTLGAGGVGYVRGDPVFKRASTLWLTSFSAGLT